MPFSRMKRNFPELSAIGQWTPVTGYGRQRWFDLITRWQIGSNCDGAQPKGENTGSAADVHAADATTEEPEDGNEETTDESLLPGNAVVNGAETTCAVGDEKLPSRDRRIQLRYLVANGNYEQLKALNAKARRMANDGWSVSLQDWKFESKPRNILISRDVCEWTGRNRLAKESWASVYPETESRGTQTVEIAMQPDRKTERADLPKAARVVAELKEEIFVMSKQLAFMIPPPLPDLPLTSEQPRSHLS